MIPSSKWAVWTFRLLSFQTMRYKCSHQTDADAPPSPFPRAGSTLLQGSSRRTGPPDAPRHHGFHLCPCCGVGLGPVVPSRQSLMGASGWGVEGSGKPPVCFTTWPFPSPPEEPACTVEGNGKQELHRLAHQGSPRYSQQPKSADKSSIHQQMSG